MKIKLLLWFAFLVFIQTNLSAQKKSTSVDVSEIRKSKYQLDVDLKNLFTGLNSSSLIFKRKINSDNLNDINSIKLIRFRASIETQSNLTDIEFSGNDIFSNSIPNNFIDLALGVGIEKQIANNNFIHYFGLEINGQYNQSSLASRPGNVFVNGNISNERIGVGLTPFFGVKYYITPRISLGLETSFSILFSKARNTEFLRRFVENSSGENIIEWVKTGTVTSNILSTEFTNLRFLTLGYRF